MYKFKRPFVFDTHDSIITMIKYKDTLKSDTETGFSTLLPFCQFMLELQTNYQRFHIYESIKMQCSCYTGVPDPVHFMFNENSLTFDTFICRMWRVMPGAASGGDSGSGTGPWRTRRWWGTSPSPWTRPTASSCGGATPTLNRGSEKPSARAPSATCRRDWRQGPRRGSRGGAATHSATERRRSGESAAGAATTPRTRQMFRTRPRPRQQQRQLPHQPCRHPPRPRGPPPQLRRYLRTQLRRTSAGWRAALFPSPRTWSAEAKVGGNNRTIGRGGFWENQLGIFCDRKTFPVVYIWNYFVKQFRMFSYWLLWLVTSQQPWHRHMIFLKWISRLNCKCSTV